MAGVVRWPMLQSPITQEVIMFKFLLIPGACAAVYYAYVVFTLLHSVSQALSHALPQ
jgi:hypothetical protein